ncbi:hypothetical protein CP061683_0724A, partial [Chlamydia psittaci 06-1683]
MYTVVGKLF